MALDIFKRYHFNKDGSINYERSSKSLGMTQSDLYYLHKGNFEYIDSATLMSGVLVGYHPTSKNPMFFAPWMMETCYHSKDNLRYIRNVITGNGTPSWETYDYFIMDASGKILFKNFDLTTKIDENGVIHLSTDDCSLNAMVYPAPRTKYPYKHYFCYGRDLNDLNKHIRMVADKKITKLPKHFKKGFTKTPLHSINELGHSNGSIYGQ